MTETEQVKQPPEKEDEQIPIEHFVFRDDEIDDSLAFWKFGWESNKENIDPSSSLWDKRDHIENKLNKEPEHKVINGNQTAIWNLSINNVEIKLMVDKEDMDIKVSDTVEPHNLNNAIMQLVSRLDIRNSYSKDMGIYNDQNKEE